MGLEESAEAFLLGLEGPLCLYFLGYVPGIPGEALGFAIIHQVVLKPQPTALAVVVQAESEDHFLNGGRLSDSLVEGFSQSVQVLGVNVL